MQEQEKESADPLNQLAARLRTFAVDREWEVFHTPKNLAMALVSEAGELAAVFQWLTPEQSLLAEAPGARAHAEDEMADVFIYLVRLADVLGVDLLKVADDKIDRNGQRYPAEQSRGRADKYTDLGPA